MAQELTEKQKQILDLQEQGLQPGEIAKKLKTSPNNIYQHLRRIREGGNGAGSKRRGRPKASGSRRRQSRRSPVPAPTPAVEVAVTPLQAVRVRRQSIVGALRESEGEVSAARKALEQAEAGHAKLTERHTVELASLDAAEKALSPNSKPRAARRPRKTAGGKGRGGKGRQRGAQAAKPSANGAKAEGERHLEPVS